MPLFRSSPSLAELPAHAAGPAPARRWRDYPATGRKILLPPTWSPLAKFPRAPLPCPKGGLPLPRPHGISYAAMDNLWLPSSRPHPVAPTGRLWPHELVTRLAPGAISAEVRTGSTAPAAAGACPVVPCSAPDSSSGSMPTISEFSVSFV
jgi:hypothetical protein